VNTDVEVLPAATAEEGMRLLGESPTDAVLLDILLPETSGLDAFENIRRVDSKLPVIFICENNLYAYSVPFEKSMAIERLPRLQAW
jgi:two-component system nitrogen regulation response regulator GlnG